MAHKINSRIKEVVGSSTFSIKSIESGQISLERIQEGTKRIAQWVKDNS